MSWYSKGGGKDQEQFRAESPNTKTLFRFWLKTGEKKDIVFIADEQFAVWEHTVPLSQGGQTRYEQFTCTRDANCRFCGEKRNATFTLYSTILDLTPYTAKDGSVKKYSRKALPIKGGAIEVINRRRQEVGGSLTGYKITVFRDGEKAPNCGNDFTVLSKVDLSKIPVEINKPIEFETMLAPLPLHVIEARLRFGGAAASQQAVSRDDFLEPAGQAVHHEDSADIPF